MIELAANGLLALDARANGLLIQAAQLVARLFA